MLSGGFESPKKEMSFTCFPTCRVFLLLLAEFSGGRGGVTALHCTAGSAEQCLGWTKIPNNQTRWWQIKISQGRWASCPYQEEEGEKVQSTFSGIFKHSSSVVTQRGLFCILLLDEHRLICWHLPQWLLCSLKLPDSVLVKQAEPYLGVLTMLKFQLLKTSPFFLACQCSRLFMLHHNSSHKPTIAWKRH